MREDAELRSRFQNSDYKYESCSSLIFVRCTKSGQFYLIHKFKKKPNYYTLMDVENFHGEMAHDLQNL